MMFGKKLPRDAVRRLRALEAEFAFLDASRLAWVGVMGGLVRALEGKEYMLRRPADLAKALQGLERHEEAMVAFAEGLAIDSKSGPLLSGLTQTMLMSPHKGEHSLLPPFPPSSSLSQSTEATYISQLCISQDS